MKPTLFANKSSCVCAPGSQPAISGSMRVIGPVSKSDGVRNSRPRSSMYPSICSKSYSKRSNNLSELAS